MDNSFVMQEFVSSPVFAQVWTLIKCCKYQDNMLILNKLNNDIYLKGLTSEGSSVALNSFVNEVEFCRRKVPIFLQKYKHFYQFESIILSLW